MRYIYLLESMSIHWEEEMRTAGVPGHIVESWRLYWRSLCVSAALAETEKIHEVAARMTRSFKTAQWYIQKAGGWGHAK